jgi:hypothetical protein
LCTDSRLAYTRSSKHSKRYTRVGPPISFVSELRDQQRERLGIARNSEWAGVHEEMTRLGSGTAIGYTRLDLFLTARMRRVRLTIDER